MLENLFGLGQVATSNVEKTLEKQLGIDADSLTSNLDSGFGAHDHSLLLFLETDC